MTKTDTLGKLLIGGGAVYLLMGGSGSLPTMPDLPAWTPLAVSAAVAGGLVAHVLAGKILALWPAEDWDIYLYEVRADDDDYAEKWGLSREYFDRCKIIGDLNALDEKGAGHYEVYRFRPQPDWWSEPNPDADEHRDEGGLIEATWRGQDGDSRIVGQYTAEHARREIREIKDEYQDEAAAAREIIERLPALARRMDRESAIRMVDLVGDDVSGDVGQDVDDILRDLLPEDLQSAVLVPDDDLGDDEDRWSPDDAPTLGQALDAMMQQDDAGAGDVEDVDAGAGGAGQAVATDGSGDHG